MSRPPSILRSSKINLCLPEDLRARLDLLLYSDSEKRVPQGAYQRFFTNLLNEFFNRGTQK